eukprot:3426527-Alexandrium_andersonii.AAC.1
MRRCSQEQAPRPASHRCMRAGVESEHVREQLRKCERAAGVPVLLATARTSAGTPPLGGRPRGHSNPC